MNLADAQKAVDDWINAHGVRYFNELTNMAQLTEEVEVVPAAMGSKVKRVRQGERLGEELTDVVFVVLCLANQTG